MNWHLKALRWTTLILSLIRIARHAYTDLIAVCAIWGAEIKSLNGKITKEAKKSWARSFMQKFPPFDKMQLTPLNKIIDSTWVFVFHKEK
jgi:hypothetical protein